MSWPREKIPTPKPLGSKPPIIFLTQTPRGQNPVNNCKPRPRQDFWPRPRGVKRGKPRFGPGPLFFCIHIFKRQYDKNYLKVYHIAFYHILKISKSISYPLIIFSNTPKSVDFLRFFQNFIILRIIISQKVYHIQFIIF